METTDADEYTYASTDLCGAIKNVRCATEHIAKIEGTRFVTLLLRHMIEEMEAIRKALEPLGEEK